MISQGSPTSESLQSILSQVNEIELLSYYFRIQYLPIVINSPLREDNRPSFGLISPDGSKVYYTDFATGEKGGFINLLMQYWKLPFVSVVNKIAEDMPLIIGNSDGITSAIYTTHKKSLDYNSDINLQVKTRDWKDYDLDYWNSYGISKPWLEFGDIYPISQIFVSKVDKTYMFPAEKYAYVYVEFKDDRVSLKVYQPFSTLFKWRSKHDHSVWDLWAKLPKTGKDLIITSSRKDALTIWENTGIPSTGLQAESYLPKVHVIDQLKQRFENIYLLYDNDFSKSQNYGRLYGTKLSQEFGLKQIEIPDGYKSKDPSDLCKNYGRQILSKLILNLLHNN